MALDPDQDLMIFKAKKSAEQPPQAAPQPQEKKVEKAKPQATPPPAPKPIIQPKAQPVPRPQPIVQPVAQPQQKVEVQEPKEKRPMFQFKPKPQAERPRPQQQKAQQEAMEPEAFYKPPEPQVQTGAQAGSEAPLPAPEAIVESLENKFGYTEIAVEPAPPQEFGQGLETAKKPTKRMSTREMKRIASHMSCENHPWRKAYAICDYCKRAFCYEDIVEHNGHFYDLDDIDKVSSVEGEAEMLKYTSLGMVSAVFFVGVFLIFMYFSYHQILALPAAMMKAGVVAYLQKMPQLMFIAEIALSVLSLFAAITVLMESQNSFKISATIGILTVTVFAYQYILTPQLYLIIITSLSFIGLVALANSRITYEEIPEEAAAGVNSEFTNMAKSSY